MYVYVCIYVCVCVCVCVCISIYMCVATDHYTLKLSDVIYSFTFNEQINKIDNTLSNQFIMISILIYLRKSSHGRESQVEMAEGVAVQLHGKWDRLRRGTVVV